MGNLGLIWLTTAWTQGKPPPSPILCVSPPHLHLNGTFSQDSQNGVPKLSWFGLPGLWVFITSRSDLRLGQGLKKTCIPPRKLSNVVLHSTCTNQDWVDSWLLMVGSQIANLTPGLSFDHNLCCICPNGSCKAILDIYTLRSFQLYKKHLDARCFDPCNCVMNFWESQRTPKSHFRECGWRPHTSLKVGLRHHSHYALAQLWLTTFWLFHLYMDMTSPNIWTFILVWFWCQGLPIKVEGLLGLAFSSTKPCASFKCLVNNHLAKYEMM